MSTGKELLKGSVTRISQTLITILISFWMMPFLVNRLGDHWYGIWTIVGSLAASYHLFDLGMVSAITRFISKDFAANDSEQANRNINTALGFYLIVSVVLILSSIALSSQSNLFTDNAQDSHILQYLVLIIGISVALEFPFNAFAGIAQAKLKFHHIALVRIIVSLLSAFLLWFFIGRGYGVIAMANISFITARLSNIAYFVICKRAFPDLTVNLKQFDKLNLKKLASFSLWSFVIAIAYQLRNTVDNFVIGYFLSASIVTHYFVGQRLVGILGQLLGQATNLFIPIFTKFHENKERQRLREYLLFTTRINLALALFSATLIFLLSKSFILCWMGSGFEDAELITKILLVGTMLGFVNNPLNSALYAVNAHKIIAKLDVVEVILNLSISIILVKSIGMVGVAYGTLIPLLLTRTFILPYLGCQKLGLPVLTYFRCYLRIIGASFLPITLTYLTVSFFDTSNYLSMVLISMSAACLYGLVVVTWGFAPHERSQLLNLIPLNFKITR
jgi:O-antigen/teichoic acid export membrane protein